MLWLGGEKNEGSCLNNFYLVIIANKLNLVHAFLAVWDLHRPIAVTTPVNEKKGVCTMYVYGNKLNLEMEMENNSLCLHVCNRLGLFFHRYLLYSVGQVQYIVHCKHNVVWLPAKNCNWQGCRPFDWYLSRISLTKECIQKYSRADEYMV